MTRFSITPLPLTGLHLIVRQRLGDTRGFLSRLFCADELRAAGWETPVAQINHVCTARRGTVRGLHFQHLPQTEMKLVSCLRGEVFDVAVDIRAGSATFLHWHAQVLSAENLQALLIPQGFAHGYQALTDGAELLYCHSAAHAPAAEAGLNPMDRRLAIAWPLATAEISDRDRCHPMVDDGFTGLSL